RRRASGTSASTTPNRRPAARHLPDPSPREPGGSHRCVTVPGSRVTAYRAGPGSQAAHPRRCQRRKRPGGRTPRGASGWSSTGSTPTPAGTSRAEGAYTEDGKARRVAVCVGPEFGTLSPDLLAGAALEACRGLPFDLLLLCGFAFDPHVA